MCQQLSQRGAFTPLAIRKEDGGPLAVREGPLLIPRKSLPPHLTLGGRFHLPRGPGQKPVFFLLSKRPDLGQTLDPLPHVGHVNRGRGNSP